MMYIEIQKSSEVRRWRSCLMALAMLFLLSLTQPVVHAQISEVAMVRGHFSGGDGIWGPEDFGWFYYDLDEGLGSEMLSVDVDERTAEEGNIIYSSRVFTRDFEYDPWGSYDSIAFLGKRYLAGYPDSSFAEAESSLEKGELRRVLVDNDEVHTFTYSDTFPLLDGYEIAVKEISENNEEVNIVLLKNKAPVDTKVVSVGDTYVYKKENIPVILVHLADAMCGEDCGIVEVDGIFQVSDKPVIQLIEGGLVDNMKLTDLSDEEILFRTNKDLNLKRDSIVPLMGGLVLVVLDTPTLIYYPQGGIFDYGVHEIRGPVYDENSTLPLYRSATKELAGEVKARWDSENFSGFFFDPKDILGREGLLINNLSGRNIMPFRSKIEDGFLVGTAGMQYTSFAQPVEFEFKPWGYYNVISLFGQLWFAGYGQNTSSEIGHIGTLSQDQIEQPLLDLDEIIPLDVGRSLPLQDGYDVALLSVSDDEAFIHLRKNGQIVDSAVLEPNSTYIYEVDVGDISDLPVIALHIQNVFNGTREEKMVLDGIFQISDRYFLPVDNNNDFGEFTIVEANAQFVFMVNPDRISLDRDSSQGLWYGMDLKVADNDTLRYYIYSRQYVVPQPKLRGIDYPKNIPSSGDANFTIAVQAAEIQNVGVDVLDPSGRTVFGRDVTDQSVGSGENWIFSWQWNATSLRLSDDGNPVLDANLPIPALLYLNESSDPIKVGILFDNSGGIATIAEGKTSYYASPYGLSMINPNLTYESMLQNDTARKEYIKIEPGRSMLRFYDYVNGSSKLNSTNHTITGPIESIDPHVERVGAQPGRYEMRLTIDNAVGDLPIGGIFFNVTSPEVRGVTLGSSTAVAGKSISVPLTAPRSGVEKRINISYDPTVVEAVGASGPCDVPSYIDPVGGRISVVMPANCSSTSLTFKVLDMTEEANSNSNANATTKLQVTDIKGFLPGGITNGSITVISESAGKTGISRITGNAPKSSAPAFAAALAAFALMAFAWRRRAG